MKKREFLTLSGAVPLMLAGCGSGSSGSAQIRLLNAAVGYPSLDLNVGTTTVTSGHVAYGSVSAYATVGDGSQATTLVDATTTNALVPTTRTLTKDGKYTVIAYGFEGSPHTVQMVETTTKPATGYASITAFNTSADIGPVNVYLTSNGNIANATPIAGSVNPGAQSGITQIGKGSYYVTITGAGSDPTNDVRMVAGPITLEDQQISTIVVTPGQSGVLARAVMVTNSSDTTVVLEGTAVRVRMVTAFLDTSASSLTVGGAQTDAITGQSIGAYITATAGAAAVTVNGVDVPITLGTGVPSTTLIAGNDYTLLVFPTDSGNAATLVLDVNTRPVKSVNFRYRLVHLVNSQAAFGISSTVGNGVISNVRFGQASDAIEATPNSSTTATVLVGVHPLVSPTAAPSGNGVYTLFTFEDDAQEGGVSGIFNPDRV